MERNYKTVNKSQREKREREREINEKAFNVYG